MVTKSNLKGRVKVKILITTDLYKPQINGVVTSIINLRSELEKEGHQVKILTISPELSSYEEDGVYYIKSLPIGVYPNIRFPISCGIKYMKEIIEWKPEVIHSQCEFFSFNFAVKISKATNAPIVHTYHTLYEQYSKYVLGGKIVTPKLLALFSKGRMRRVQTVIAPSEKVLKKLEQYRVNRHIEVIPTGINLEEFYKDKKEEDILKLKKHYGLDRDKKIILSLGRLGFEKRIDEIINGFSMNKKLKDIAVILIVGDGPARMSLEQLAKERGVEKNIIFVGMVSPEDVSNYYKMADIFVSASTSETQGLTYVEAAASGLPLVCRYDPCVEDLIVEGENGYVYHTIEELSDCLEKSLMDEKIINIANVKSKTLANKFGKEYFGQQIEDVYRQSVQYRKKSYRIVRNYV